MKMKKLTALALAGALCLGMSATAFAADSVTPVNGDKTKIEYTDKFGDKVTEEDVDVEVKTGALNEAAAEKVEEWKEDNDKLVEDITAAAKAADITLKEGASYAVATAADYKVYVDGKEADLTMLGANGAKLTLDFDLNNIKDIDKMFEKNPVIYLMHGVTAENGGTDWVLIEAAIQYDARNKSYYATAEFDSLSPIAFVLEFPGAGDDVIVTPPTPGEDQKPVTPDEIKPSNPNGTVTVDDIANAVVRRLQAANTRVVRTSTVASPKTGE